MAIHKLVSFMHHVTMVVKLIHSFQGTYTPTRYYCYEMHFKYAHTYLEITDTRSIVRQLYF